MGSLIGAQFLAATGGDMEWFNISDRLAGIAAIARLAPAPRDSGRVSGNHQRPQRFHRGLQRVLLVESPRAAAELQRATASAGYGSLRRSPMRG